MLKIGIVGAGKIVSNAHLPVLTSMSQVAVSWVTDLSASRANSLSTIYQVPCLPIEHLHKGILSVDALLLAIPYHCRSPYLQLAADHEKALYVEKPFARSLAEHTEIEARFRPERLAVGFQRRTYASIQSLRDLISSEMFGPLLAIKVVACEFDLKSGGAESFLSNSNQAGGGVLMESAVHHLDQIVYLTQATNVRLQKLQSIIIDDMDYEVRCTAKLTREDGADVLADLLASRLRTKPFQFICEFETATVYAPRNPEDDVRIAATVGLSPARERWICKETDSPRSISAAFRCFWELFEKAIRSQTPNLTSAVSSRTTSAWLGAVYDRILAASQRA